MLAGSVSHRTALTRNFSGSEARYSTSYNCFLNCLHSIISLLACRLAQEGRKKALCVEVRASYSHFLITLCATTCHFLIALMRRVRPAGSNGSCLLLILRSGQIVGIFVTSSGHVRSIAGCVFFSHSHHCALLACRETAASADRSGQPAFRTL